MYVIGNIGVETDEIVCLAGKEEERERLSLESVHEVDGGCGPEAVPRGELRPAVSSESDGCSTGSEG